MRSPSRSDLLYKVFQTTLEKAMADNIPLGQWSGSDATNALHETIKKYQEASSKQTAQMLRLTWTIALLTLVMLLGLGIQIYLALKPCSG